MSMGAFCADSDEGHAKLGMIPPSPAESVPNSSLQSPSTGRIVESLRALSRRLRWLSTEVSKSSWKILSHEGSSQVDGDEARSSEAEVELEGSECAVLEAPSRLEPRRADV